MQQRANKSAAEAIAKVDGSGNVQGVKAGGTKITVTTYNGKTAALSVTVVAAPTKVAFNASGYTVYNGKTVNTAVKRGWMTQATAMPK
ncbi:MAG: hypothetical protein LBJ12_07915 [Oscillospiraceae bacterium]|jgi:uncharacterized protein YjdB|nr:hypothetical protein [Oscillospiraceae bacterium]